MDENGKVIEEKWWNGIRKMYQRFEKEKNEEDLFNDKFGIILPSRVRALIVGGEEMSTFKKDMKFIFGNLRTHFMNGVSYMIQLVTRGNPDGTWTITIRWHRGSQN